MFKSIRIQFSILLLAAISLNSCKSEYQKVLKGNDLPKKYEMAKKYYNEKDYFRAFQLLDELVNVYRGSEEAETIYYYYAYCNYGLKDLISARFHFQNFAETYPRSKYAEECRYMSAYCYFLESPDYTLDQDNTYKAIEAMQLFINMYPQSERIAECNNIIDRLREKLESKSYANAKLYYNIGDYKSAIFAIRNSLIDFPDSKYREEMMFLSIKSAYLYADMSIESKKSERFLETIEYYQTFVDSYASSKYLKEAQSIFNNSLSKIENLKKLSN
jgi:outer membrane protein assembly factor BamD